VQKVGFVKYKSGLLHGHKMKIGQIVLGTKTNGFWPPQWTAQGVGVLNLNICAKDKKNFAVAPYK